MAERTLHWMSLPTEIRSMILEAITQQKHPGWASFASVCKEWQFIIEKRNFYRLKLRVGCLATFKQIIRPREFICHISLDIELPKYACPNCSLPYRSLHSDNIFTKGIWRLLSILSKWNPGNSLTLELNAHSPSDSEHWFKGCQFASDDVGNEIVSSTLDAGVHDPEHGWTNGQQISAPPRRAVLRLFEPIDSNFAKEFPRVDVVKCFIIRRQLRRQLTPMRLRLILGKLDGLEHLIYEPWRVMDSIWKWERDHGMLILF
jgi:hypothetical protein